MAETLQRYWIALNDITIPPDAPPLFLRVTQWIRTVFDGVITHVHALLGYDEDGLTDIDRAHERLDTVDSRVKALEQRLGSKGTGKATETVALASSAPSSKASPRKLNPNIRCNRCHARGHIQSECRSVNPEVVRKRVAQNKRAQANKAPTLARLPAPSAPPYSASTIMPPLDPYIISLAADAAELRRRADQSIRDKKRSRKASAPH